MKARKGLFLLLGAVFSVVMCIPLTTWAWPKCPDGSPSLQAENGQYICPSKPQPPAPPVSVGPVQGGDANATSQSTSKSNANSASDSNSNANAKLTGTVEGTNTLQNTTNQRLSDSGNGTATSAQGQSTSVDAANRSITNNNSSSRSLTVTLPPLMQALPPTFSQTGEIKEQRMECGPLQSIQSEIVEGIFIGFTGNSEVYLGKDEHMVPYMENGKVVRYHEEVQSDGSVRRFGHQPTVTTTPLVVSGARQFGMGAFNGSGGGQIGGGASGAMARLVSRVQLRECELPGYKIVVESPPVIITPPPPVKPSPSKPKRKSCPCHWRPVSLH